MAERESNLALAVRIDVIAVDLHGGRMHIRSTLGKVLDTLDQLEAALKQNDSASAKELILKLNDIKREGHKKFKSPD